MFSVSARLRNRATLPRDQHCVVLRKIGQKQPRPSITPQCPLNAPSIEGHPSSSLAPQYPLPRKGEGIGGKEATANQLRQRLRGESVVRTSFSARKMRAKTGRAAIEGRVDRVFGRDLQSVAATGSVCHQLGDVMAVQHSRLHCRIGFSAPLSTVAMHAQAHSHCRGTSGCGSVGSLRDCSHARGRVECSHGVLPVIPVIQTDYLVKRVLLERPPSRIFSIEPCPLSRLSTVLPAISHVR